MTETESYTSVPGEGGAQAEQVNGGSAAAALLAGALAMVLIYLTAVFLPKIAAFTDRLLGIKKKELPPQNPAQYKVKDIYEGEKNLDDDNGKGENDNG